MTDRPQVSSADVLAGGDDEPDRSPTGLRRLAALLLAAGMGFAAAQLITPSASGGASGAGLALVTGRQPHLEAVSGDAPVTAMEVTLVNTGTAVLRLDAAEVEGSGLAWDVDRPLQPGQQAAALLRDERPCEGPLDALSRPGAPQRVRVRAHDEQTAERLPDVVLRLPPAVGRLYDDHVRLTCALPRLPEALEVLAGPSTLVGEELVVPFGVLSRSVRTLQVDEVAVAVPGLTARLTARDGRPVPLPLTLPGRSRLAIAEGVPYDDPSSTPYRLRLAAAGPQACGTLVDPSGGESVVVRYVDPDEPGVVAGRPVPLDLTPLVERACAPSTGAPPR